MEVRASEHNGAVALQPVGELDVDSAPTLYDSFRNVLSQHPLMVELDLSALTFVDSTGLSTFVRMKRETECRGGVLRLTSVPSRVRRVLEVTRLNTFLLGDLG